MKPELKKLLVLNLPYLLFVYLFAKCGQAYRLCGGRGCFGQAAAPNERHLRRLCKPAAQPASV